MFTPNGVLKVLPDSRTMLHTSARANLRVDAATSKDGATSKTVFGILSLEDG